MNSCKKKINKSEQNGLKSASAKLFRVGLSRLIYTAAGRLKLGRKPRLAEDDCNLMERERRESEKDRGN